MKKQTLLNSALRVSSAIVLSIGLILPQAALAQNNRQNNGNHRTSSGNVSQQRGKQSSGNMTVRPSGQTTNRPTATSPTQNRPGNMPSGTNRPTDNRVPQNNMVRPGQSNMGNHTPTPPKTPQASRPIAPGKPGWTAPPPPIYNKPLPSGNWNRPLPVPPRRPAPVYYRSSPIIHVWPGLTYGSLLNAGINLLVNAGLNVISAANNAIYLQNVGYYGVNWPEVTVFYNNGMMNGARYQYPSLQGGMGTYNMVYRELCAAYGNPVSYNMTNGITEAVWWGGNNSGYVTLRYTPAYATNSPYYYTDLIYGR